ncbi:MAG: N-acetyl-gamma-glutamyl-phosphate reductase [Candidatus Tectimicrobiota bacterium]|nr:MAG: N-acetyl-gamma-glutamyl-phosphate reductase [Candidatus Tectomicrobia bacterium]
MHPIKASVIGASGYGGAETVRLLSTHPAVELVHVTGETQQGQPLAALYPNLRGFVSQTLIAADAERIGRDSHVVFVSLPSGKAMHLVPALLAQGCKVIDLAADFRLRDPALYPKWYRFTHVAPQYLAEAVYGLPELHREAIAGARLVANPGCYPVAALLALLPLVRAGVVQLTGLIIDAKSGISGAGRGGGGGFGYSEVNENVRAYGVAGHNHTAEIEQELSAVAGTRVRLVFTPHLIPMTRGILVTAYAPLRQSLSEAEALALYEEAYAQAPFVRVLRDSLPQTKATLGSNFCDVTVRIDARTQTAIALAAIDNLGRGAAGQAVQNMNLMFALPETTGLRFPGLFP